MNPSADLRPRNIWEIEAVMMSLLQESGTLKWLKDLCRKSAQPEILEAAMIAKHRSVVQRLNSTKDRVEIFQLWSELRRLFPDDPVAKELPKRVQKRMPVLSRRQLAWIFLIFLLFTSGFGAWKWWGTRKSYLMDSEKVLQTQNTLPQVTTSMPPVQVPAAETTVRSTESIAKTEFNVKDSARPKPQSAAAPIAKKGFVSFVVPDDVEIYVDGESIPTENRKSFALNPGRYSVTLEKSGYLPINERITVHAGKTTTVRAGGAQK